MTVGMTLDPAAYAGSQVEGARLIAPDDTDGSRAGSTYPSPVTRSKKMR